MCSACHSVSEIFQFLTSLVRDYGYLGFFVGVSLANAIVLLPIPAVLLVILGATMLDPLPVILIGALAAAVGKLTGYSLGRLGGRTIERRINLSMTRSCYYRYGVWAVYLFAALPLPFGLIGILSGVLMMSPILFFVLTLAGKLTSYSVYGLTGRSGIEIIFSFASKGVNLASVAILAGLGFVIVLLGVGAVHAMRDDAESPYNGMSGFFYRTLLRLFRRVRNSR